MGFAEDSGSGEGKQWRRIRELAVTVSAFDGERVTVGIEEDTGKREEEVKCSIVFFFFSFPVEFRSWCSCLA